MRIAIISLAALLAGCASHERSSAELQLAASNALQDIGQRCTSFPQNSDAQWECFGANTATISDPEIRWILSTVVQDVIAARRVCVKSFVEGSLHAMRGGLGESIRCA